VIQERVIGTSLQNVYYKLPLGDKLKIATLVTDLMLKIGDIIMEKPGRVAAKQVARPTIIESITTDTECVLWYWDFGTLLLEI